MARFEIDVKYLQQVLVDLLNTPSPTGDTDWAISFVEQELDNMGVSTTRTTKGALIATIPGLQDNAPRAVTAHVDTLGAVISEIKSNGRLRLSAIGGVNWASMESEGLTINTQSGNGIRGSLVQVNGAVHVNKESISAVRSAGNLEVRIDERTTSAEETRYLGIEVGDFVAFDPRVEVNPSGYIRSRFLDDKACVACALATVKSMVDAGVSPAQRTHILISNFEEVGHGGMDSLPADLNELLVLDMAVIGDGQNGEETQCSICVKDSSGPYSKALTTKVRNIADTAGVVLKPDVYPYYGSDGSAYWRSGGTAQVALIGPGVDTSHGYERTHIDALRDTSVILAEYLVTE